MVAATPRRWRTNTTRSAWTTQVQAITGIDSLTGLLAVRRLQAMLWKSSKTSTQRQNPRLAAAQFVPGCDKLSREAPDREVVKSSSPLEVSTAEVFNDARPTFRDYSRQAGCLQVCSTTSALGASHPLPSLPHSPASFTLFGDVSLVAGT